MKIKRILVSQPRPDSEKSPYFELAEKNNVKIDFRPFSHVEGVPCKDFRKQRIDILAHTAVIFNSKTAIDHFFRMCGELQDHCSGYHEIFLYFRICGFLSAEIYYLPETKNFLRCRHHQ